MSRSALALVLAALVAALAGARPTLAARPWPCLPPVFDQGQRLHPLPNPDVYWLELTLRQHELCWREPKTPGELRVALYGSSAPYGFPLPAEQGLSGLLNAHFDAIGMPAHVYNLAMVITYQVRDAVIMEESLAYEPDVIIYPITLADFRHLAPLPDPVATNFFRMNATALQRTIDAAPAGLEEPFAVYQRWLDERTGERKSTDQLREVGRYVRQAVRVLAEAIAARLDAPIPPPEIPTGRRQIYYDCAKTQAASDFFQGFQQWNVLAYLAELQRQRGIRVLVVQWPIAREPVGACYSARFTADQVLEFSDWVRAEVVRHNLAYVDLHQFLAAGFFSDSLHVTADGQQRIATTVAQVLDPILETVLRVREAQDD
jgi:hypothetical protein